MTTLRFLLSVSRPRFWIYVLGPFLVGTVAGAVRPEEMFRTEVILFALYFIFPANLLIYGINDIFDFETDRLNPKKSEYEMLVRPESHRRLLIWILLFNIPFFIAAYFLAPQALLSLAGFILFSLFYSAPPIRAKAIPILDSVFNVLYVFPGAFAYQMLTDEFPPLYLFTAGWLWTMGMHAYSAIPDIEADKEAGVATTATLLGHSWTHLFCGLCFCAASILSVTAIPAAAIILGFVYVPLMRFSELSKNRSGVFGYYRVFPLINAVSGFFLFWYVALNKFL